MRKTLTANCSVVQSSKNIARRKTIDISLSPMMPKQYSAREREEIRKKELQILRGF